MKKILFTLTIITIVLFRFMPAMAQEEVTLTKNDSLIIEMEGYKNGEIQWERATNVDGTNWNAMANTPGSTALRHKATTPYYFRSKVVDGTCDPSYTTTIKTNIIGDLYKIKAGHGYAEPYTSSPGLSMEEKGSLSSWSNQSRKAVWYLYQKPGKYEVSFLMRANAAKDFEFQMNTSPCYDGLDYEPETFDFTCTTTKAGSNEVIPAFTVEISKIGYYRYELTAKNSMSGLVIDELQFQGIKQPGRTSQEAHATDYLSSPSVHLNFSSTASTTREYDWLYEEIIVPEGFDPLASYYMSIGFFRGYMGIQTNSDTERRVLFSVWDVIDRDKYPDAPKELCVSLVDKADYTQANSFGGEGTGGQSYVGKGDVNTWKTGTPVKFMMNCRRDGTVEFDGQTIRHSILSAWYDAGDGWRYIASWRTPVMPGSSNKDMFDGFHSFLENYGWRNGQLARKAYYYNTFGKELATGKWIHLNKASFSNTDGSVGQRIDFEQGISEEDPTKFYMLSGGYGQTKKTGNTVPLIKEFPYLENLDLTPFEQRVTEALEREEYLNNLPFLDKTGWEVISFSSEEKTGEPNGNGLAKLIIDGDDATYWHSQWQGGGSSFPHWFVIDMKAAQTIKGFKFLSSDGVRRQMKNIKIEVSNSADSGWTEIWSGIAPMNPNLLELDAAVSGNRYLKLTIIDGYEDGAHTRVNEIYVF